MSELDHIKPIRRGQDAALDNEAKPLAAGAELRISVRRMRAYNEAQPIALPQEAEVEEAGKAIADFSDSFEKLHLKNNLLPAAFLRRGAAQCDTVCRIVIRSATGVLGYGTGFLVGPGVILTNNHVLNSKGVAVTSTAEFFFEEGRDPVVAALRPDAFFLTSAALDYTFVGCAIDNEELKRVVPAKISRNPAVVAKGEMINIIQHPEGRRKEVAVHDNEVTAVLEKVIRYRTDTQPGSSGSMACNREWQLVALHHAGWEEAGGAATNEGVRIAAIVLDLVARAKTETDARAVCKAVLDDAEDFSPYLGFFDLAGAGGSPLEVEVPDFTGSRDFADLGFWNIEHFNGDVSDDRVRDVASVMSRLSMDVMGLTEVEEPALQRLIEQLRQGGDEYAYAIKDAPGRQDIAAFYDTDTTQVRIADDLYQRFAAELNATTTSGATAFPRHPLIARCSVADGNTAQVQFLLVVVHLKAFGDKQSKARRRLASEVLLKIIAHVRSAEQLPIVLGGDFNEVLGNDVLAPLQDSPDLFGLTADDATGDAISYVGASHQSLIDHIIVSRDVKTGDIQGDDAAIVRLDQSVSDFAQTVSDHVPVVVRLVYREAPEPVNDRRSASDETSVAIPPNASRVRLSFS